jgi:hypothetical protein
MKALAPPPPPPQQQQQQLHQSAQQAASGGLARSEGAEGAAAADSERGVEAAFGEEPVAEAVEAAAVKGGRVTTVFRSLEGFGERAEEVAAMLGEWCV